MITSYNISYKINNFLEMFNILKSCLRKYSQNSLMTENLLLHKPVMLDEVLKYLVTETPSFKVNKY